MTEKKEIQKINWIDTSQIANPLTKLRASCQLLLDSLEAKKFKNLKGTAPPTCSRSAFAWVTRSELTYSHVCIHQSYT